MASANVQIMPEAKLVELGLKLHPAPGPLGAYAPWVITGQTLITSGQFPWKDKELAYTGRIGSSLSPEQSYDACRLAALSGVGANRGCARVAEPRCTGCEA
jgi:enamine deaminase RidA (YjgF/YER057c/UK114 family)